MKTIAPWLTAVIVLAGAGSAHAQKSPNSAAAEALFADARRLEAQGDEAGACEKFAKSEATEHALGTLLNVAVCDEKQGKIATAWTEFSRARSEAARLPDPPREKFALAHIQALEPKLHRVVVDAPAGSAGLEIKIDGVPLAPDAWGAGLPMDPGQHTLVADAPGKVSWVHPLTVTSEPGTEHVAVPVLADATASPVPTLEAPAASSAPEAPVGSEPQPPARSDSTVRTLGLVVAGAGVIALAVSVYTTFRTFSDANDRDSQCPPGLPCPSPAAYALAQQSDSDARTNRTIAIATGIGGAAAVGIGAFLYLRSPSPAVRVGLGLAPRVGGTQLALRGWW